MIREAALVFLIELTGTGSFVGSCVVDGQPVLLEGVPPQTHRLPGREALCEFRQLSEGSIRVTATAPRGNRSVATMGGPGGSLRVHLR